MLGTPVLPQAPVGEKLSIVFTENVSQHARIAGEAFLFEGRLLCACCVAGFLGL